MNALDLAQPRYAHLARPAFDENELRDHLIEHHAQHGALPTVRALREKFGGGNSRLIRIRQSVEVELGLRAAESSPRRTLGRLETVTSRLTDIGESWSAADAPVGILADKVEALEARLERREIQMAKALVALHEGLKTLHALVERLEPAMGSRFRKVDDFIAEQRAGNAPAAFDSRSAKTATDRLDQAVARAESALESRASSEPPSAWVRSAAASATAALDGRLQSIEEALRDHAALAQNELRAVSEATQQATAEAVIQFGGAKDALARVAEIHRQETKHVHPLVTALHAQLGHTRQRDLEEDRRAGALSQALVALADLQLAQVEVFEAGMVALESQVVEHAPSRRQSHQGRRSRPSRRSRPARR